MNGMQPEKEQELEQELSYFRDQFKELNQQIELPDSLQPENMQKLIENIEPTKQKDKLLKINFRRLAGIAACFLIVVGSVFVIRNHDIQAPTEQAPQLLMNESIQEDCDFSQIPETVKNSVGFLGDYGQEFYGEGAVCQDDGIPETVFLQTDDEPFYADNYSQIKNVIVDMNQGMDAIQFESGLEEAGIESKKSVRDLQTRSIPASPPPQPSHYLEDSLSYSNAEIANPKAAKTDGKYLYYFVESGSNNPTPNLYIVDSTTMQIESKLSMNAHVSEFYIYDNQLITIENAENAIPMDKLSENTVDDAVDTQNFSKDKLIASQVTVFDITNHKNPKKVKTYAQSGICFASTVTDDTLYLVSNYDMTPSSTIANTDSNSFVPATYNSSSNQAQYLRAEQILINPQSNFSRYTMVSALDLKSGEIYTQSVLGGSHKVYFGNDDIYLYSANDNASQAHRMTHIMRFSYQNHQLQYIADQTISGSLNSSSFNAKNGELRIFAIDPQVDGKTVYHVYSMNSKMQPMGSFDGLVMEDEISSMCYMNDMIFLTKQNQTNELVTIDISNPENINETCSRNLTNFNISTLIPKPNENILFALGNDTQTNTIKLCVFSILNSQNIELLDTYTFANSDNETEQFYDSEVFLCNESTIGILAYSLDDQENAKMNLCLFSFNRENGLQLNAKFEQNSESFVEVMNHSFILDDILYTFSSNSINRYNVQTMERTSSLLLD